ncbi:hypothetical protein [Natronomonas sp. EA1]|uniref:hypothetical protein n=1 Tax=Natronomonas sp. EA1 TaxID=3421655 RepID=UPI003EBE9FA3
MTFTDAEHRALEQACLGSEHLYAAFGHLIEWHHQIGHGMAQFENVMVALRASGHDDLADRLRDELLPAGVIDDKWSYEVVDEFREEFLEAMATFEADLREELDAPRHVHERELKAEARARAESN